MKRKLEFFAKIEERLRSAPVDVKAIAEDEGLAIFGSHLADGISGALLREPEYGTASGFVILVNETEAYVRQRFTAAHELGHFVLHREFIGEGIRDNYLLRAEGFSSVMETQANQFAADLLMPYPLISQLVAEGLTSVEVLAKRLQVSQVAMAIRLDHPT